MRLAPAFTVAAMAFATCSVASPDRPMSIEFDKPFSLRPGESGHALGADLRVGFDTVTADSRCPKGVQCVWAGDAKLRVWLQQGHGPRQAVELHTAAGPLQAAVALAVQVRLLRLDPYPVGTQVLAQQDYVATLSINRSAAAGAAPER